MTFLSQCDSTSLSLLRRVQQHDAVAWERFCRLYGPLVYDWCRRSGLQDCDSADVAQEVFRAVCRGIEGFHPRKDVKQNESSGTFRGWLWTITRNQIHLHFRKQGQRPISFGGNTAQQRLAEQSVTIPDEITDSDTHEPNSGETWNWMVHRALELIRDDFRTTTWEAFRRVMLQGEAIPEVAVDLGMTENAIRQAKFRVLRRLRDELDGQF